MRPFDNSRPGRVRAKGAPLDRAGWTPSQEALPRLPEQRAEHGGASVFGRGSPSPLALVRNDRLLGNVDAMAMYCRAHDVLLAPHNKTALSPEVAALQLREGAFGLTVANARQASVVHGWGVRRILIANEVVDPAGLAWIAGALDDPGDPAEIYVFADSRQAVALLEEALPVPGPGARMPAPLRVFTELGTPGGRCGARSPTEALAVARSIGGASPRLALAGVATFEGLLGAERDAATLGRVRRLTRDALELAGHIAGEGLLGAGRGLVTAGGSSFFDGVVDAYLSSAARAAGFRLVLRSGGYAFHDHGMYADVSPLDRPGLRRLRPALELWSSVLSLPEPGTAICDFGRRDTGSDAGHPVAAGLRTRGGRPKTLPGGIRVTGLNDQHAYLRVPPDHGLAVGDRLGFGISHPCSTLDRWDVLPAVDEAYRVVGHVTVSL
ncbi:alanine racemase [Streptomyces sp. NPDC051018]|uniref:alanine racemase n=1 Tax=Streptomyces sp. NPDC051018 TaxID=3365639 RepID=UPI0037AAE5F5